MSKKSFNDKNHLYGRVFLALAIVMIVLIPIIMAIVLQVMPEWDVVIRALATLIVFIIGGFVEVMTYSPMLGTAGTYLAFFTGNLVNLKVPCAVNAREQANVKHGSQEGEIVSTLSVATSTIVTTVIIALGVALLVPLTPVLENPVLRPAFNSAFTALFGALAYKYFTKDIKLVPLPLILSIVLAFTLKLDTSVLIPICAIASIVLAVVLFKAGKNKQTADKDIRK